MNNGNIIVITFAMLVLIFGIFVIHETQFEESKPIPPIVNDSFQPLTKSQYIQFFDEVNMHTYGGTGYSTKNSPTWWAWDNAPIVEAQVDMYEATKNTKYLDMVMENTV